MNHGNSRDDQWVERVVWFTSLLGFNPVRVRWKLTNWMGRTREQATLTRGHIRHAGYEHKICPDCGRLQDRGNRRCENCNARLPGRFWQVLGRLGLRVPSALSISSVLTLLIIAAYLRVALAGDPENSFFSFHPISLFRFGGLFGPAVRDGQWWRLGTAVFLHAGVLHIGFNLFALSQIGPLMEKVFGRDRFLLYFVVMGMAASLTSSFFLKGIGIGASGAIMGLIGLGAAWGHRQGTAETLYFRNVMLKWVAYTLLFGLFANVDNVAHIAGFVSGAALGWLTPVARNRRGGSSPVLLAGTILSAVLVAWFLFKIFTPMELNEALVYLVGLSSQ